MKPVHRYISLVLAILFGLFAFFQLNDLDPELWVPIYLSAAGICLLAFLRRLYLPLIGAALVGYIVGAILYWPDKWEGVSLDGGYTVNIEEARESLGLGICAIAMIYLLVLAIRQQRKKA